MTSTKYSTTVTKHLKQQMARQLLAIISLLVAFTALGYNTWRNEQTEANRNVRAASFELLIHLGELQVIADYAHYERDQQRGNPITGWGRVLTIQDLAAVVNAETAQQADQLQLTWQAHWDGLGTDPIHAEKIHQQIKLLRGEVKHQLAQLD